MGNGKRDYVRNKGKGKR